MFRFVAEATVASFVVLTVVGLAGVAVSRRFWRQVPALAVCCGIAFVALVSWIQFLLSWADPTLGAVGSWLLLAGCFGVAMGSRPWRWAGFLIAPVALTAGLGAVYQGLLYLWKSDLEPFPLSALRFSFTTSPYPVDNALPWLMSNAIEYGNGTHGLIPDWNGSDRPPLESGAILLVQHVLGWTHPAIWTAPAYGAGFVLQLSWIPALWALLEVIGTSRVVAALATASVGVTGTMVVNSVYTWPKLICAALVCGSMAVLVAAIRHRCPLLPSLVAAAAMYTLGMLAHGAAAFTLPAIALLAVWAIARGSRRRASTGAAAATVMLLYAPWVAYQRFADPPGDRLLKMHLAGVDGLDDRSLVRTILDQYSTLDAGSWLRGRWDNLAQILTPGVVTSFDGQVDASGPGMAGRLPPDFASLSHQAAVIGEWRWHEYYEWVSSLGIGFVLLAVLLVAFLVALRQHRWRHLSWQLLISALMALSMLFWVLVMFVPGSTVVHQGSHVWIVVPLGLAVAWLAERRFWWGVAWLAVQATITAIVYGPFFGYSRVSPAGVVALSAGAVVVAVTLRGSGLPRHGLLWQRLARHQRPSTCGSRRRRSLPKWVPTARREDVGVPMIRSGSVRRRRQIIACGNRWWDGTHSSTSKPASPHTR